MTCSTAMLACVPGVYGVLAWMEWFEQALSWVADETVDRGRPTAGGAERYHTSHWVVGRMGWPTSQPNAAWNSGSWESVPMTR